MKTKYREMAALAGGLILILIGPAFAQDWPQWRGPNRDDKVSGFTAPEKWPEKLTEKWKTKVGTGDATPALVGDKIYAFARQGNEEVVQCLKAADGTEIWNKRYEAQAVTGSAAQHPGPRSSPAVADGKVVTLGVGGTLLCLDAATGKELWRKDDYPKVPRFFTSVSPIIVDGMVIAQLGTKGNGAAVAYDLATGNQKWKWDLEGPDYSSPVLMTVEGTKQIVALTEKSVVGVGVADGKLLWQVPFVPAGMNYNAATPIIDGETVIVTGQGRGTKAFKIEKQGDAFSAKELWSNPQIATQFNTPVLKDGLLFGSTGQGNFFCLNAKTGQTAWTDQSKKIGQFDAMLDAGSVIVALPNNAELTVFKSSDKEYTEIAKIKVSDTQTYAHPVLAGKRILIKDKENVTLYTLD